MRIFLVHNPAIISPMDAPACDAWLLDSQLAHFMQRMFTTARLSTTQASTWEEAEDLARKEPEGAFICSDSVVCSRSVLKHFVHQARSQQGTGAYICAIPHGRGTNFTARVDGLNPVTADTPDREAWSAPLYFLRGNSSISQAEPLIIPYKERLLHYSIPPGLLDHHKQVYALSESYLCNVRHWIHIHRINLAALAAFWLERVQAFGYIGGLTWYAWRLLCGFPWTGGRLLESIRCVSTRAQVNHSAHVDLSIIEKGAKISPKAIISKSYIGAGATVLDGAQVIGSVIGPGAYVGRSAMVVSSVVYPRALASQFLMQASVLGEEACALANSCFFDMSFSKNIRVTDNGKLVDIGSPFLGVCVGPRARVSAGVWVAYGREVPAGALLVKPPDEVMSNLSNAQTGTTAICRDGKAELLNPDQALAPKPRE